MRIRRLAARARGGIRTVRGFVPLSFSGLLLGGGGYYLWRHMGQGQSDYVLRGAGVFAMTTVGAAVAMVLLASGALWWGLRRQPPEEGPKPTDADSELKTGFSFSALTLWPWVDVSMTWDEPQGVSVRLTRTFLSYAERVTPTERGRITSVRRRFVVRDVFGLSRFVVPFRRVAGLRVAPAQCAIDSRLAHRLSSGEAVSHPAGEPEGELVEMRRYAPGDPLRLVLWKTFARTRRLLVRMPERAIAPKPEVLGCFVAGEADEPSASAARAFLDNGLLGETFVFAVDGSSHPTSSREEALDRIITSRQHYAHGGEVLDRVLRDSARHLLYNVICFVPARRGDWLPRVKAFITSLPARPTIIVATDTWAPARRRGWLRRLPERLRPRRRRGTRLPEVVHIHDELAALGADVRILHRPSGRGIGPVELAGLRKA